jgi:hypothetical protein
MAVACDDANAVFKQVTLEFQLLQNLGNSGVCIIYLTGVRGYRL